MRWIFRLAAALAIIVVAAALLWIAAINMIDATIMVTGRVVDSRGRAVSGAEVTLQVGNRTLRGRTKEDGTFFIAATTTFLKHECVLRVGSEKLTLVAPGRHHLDVTLTTSSL